MLEGELSDPRIAPCYVTEVILTPGGKSCRVLIAVQGGEEAEAETLNGLMTARAYIRTEIRDRMGVRHVPELTFVIDRSERLGARMDELLGRIQKRKEKLQRKVDRQTPPAAPENAATPATTANPKAPKAAS